MSFPGPWAARPVMTGWGTECDGQGSTGVREAAAMMGDIYPVQWTGSQAVIALPEHIDLSNAGAIREELLSLINRGAASLIADMTATISCDHAGADAMARAFQRALASGTELRLVVRAQIVRRVIGVTGLDRLIAIYPTLEAATAARAPTPVRSLTPRTSRPVRQTEPGRSAWAGSPGSAARPPHHETIITPAIVWSLVEALSDGVALSDGSGNLALVNRQLEEIFGYGAGELAGRPVETLIPAHLGDIHRRHRDGYAAAPRARPMGARARLVGLHKDGTTFPVEISLSPIPTATGPLTLTVIRDMTETRRLESLARLDLAQLTGLARAEGVADQAHRSQELLEKITAGICQVGLTLRMASDQPAEAVQAAIARALQQLDDTVRDIGSAAFTDGLQSTEPG